MEDDDFTFPTVAAARAPAPPEGKLVGPPVAHLLHQLPLRDLAAASPLWPFAGSPKATAPSSSPAPVAADGEAAPVSGSTGRAEHRAEADGGQEERRATADEERMDLLWEGATTTAPATQPTGSGAGYAEPPPNPKPRRAEADDGDTQRAAAVADAESMDKLWESFNEEPLLLRRARSKSAAADRPGAKDWYLCSYPPSEDAGSEDTAASSPAERRGYGCAPTMLRASSRAGGAGQFCGSPRVSSRRRGGRGAAAGWALLLRLFRRLFAVDKTTTASRSHASIYVP